MSEHTLNTPRSVIVGECGIETSVIGYGTYHLLDKLDPSAAIGSFAAAFEAGVTLFDLSDNYGTELAIGRAVQDGVIPRERVVIATKTGLATSASEAVRWGAERSVDTSPERIRNQVEKSLWLLGDEVRIIDLYQLHAHDPAVPAYQHAEIMNQFIDEGKIRAYGVSNYNAEALNELLTACDAVGLVRPATLQPFHTILTSFEDEAAIDAARSAGMTILAHSPLLKGAFTDSTVQLLSDAIDQAESRGDAANAADWEVIESVQAGLNNLKLLQEYARDNGHTLAQLGVAWVAMQDSTIVLTACTTPEYLAEAVDASAWRLDSEGLALVESIRSAPETRSFAGYLLNVMKKTKIYYR